MTVEAQLFGALSSPISPLGFHFRHDAFLKHSPISRRRDLPHLFRYLQRRLKLIKTLRAVANAPEIGWEVLPLPAKLLEQGKEHYIKK